MLEKIELAKRRIRQDPKYKRLKRALEELPVFRVPLEEITDELKFIQSSRKIRALRVSNPKFHTELIEAVLLDQSNRSRITEILIDCTAARSSIDRAITSFKDYALIEYCDLLKMFSTKAERLTFVEGVLRTFITFIQRIEELERKCRYVIEDIDKAGYSTKHIVDVWKTVYVTERQV